ncbi:MAG: hypothetical protein U0517_02705 [Candidatus Andersenbacteria bacterium]
MSKRGLLIWIVLLLLLLTLEGALIFLYPERGTYPFFSNGSATQSGDNSLPPPVTPADKVQNETGGTTDTATLKSAVRVLDYVQKSQTPAGGPQQETYRETHQLLADKQPDGTWKVALVTRNDRSADEVNRGTIIIEKDGSYYLTELEVGSSQGSFTCNGKMPGYLAVGKNTASATLTCSFSGGGASFAALTYTGSVTASAPTPKQFNGKTYQARTLTITGSFSPGGSTAVPQGIQFVSAPGIGELSSSGTLGDLIFGQLSAIVSGESTGTLVSMDNDQFFLP